MRQSSKVQVWASWLSSFGQSSKPRLRIQHYWWIQLINVCSRCQMVARTCQLLRSLKILSYSAKKSKRRIKRIDRVKNPRTTCRPATTAKMFKMPWDNTKQTLIIWELHIRSRYSSLIIVSILLSIRETKSSDKCRKLHLSHLRLFQEWLKSRMCHLRLWRHSTSRWTSTRMNCILQRICAPQSTRRSTRKWRAKS